MATRALTLFFPSSMALPLRSDVPGPSLNKRTSTVGSGSHRAPPPSATSPCPSTQLLKGYPPKLTARPCPPGPWVPKVSAPPPGPNQTVAKGGEWLGSHDHASVCIMARCFLFGLNGLSFGTSVPHLHLQVLQRFYCIHSFHVQARRENRLHTSTPSRY